MLGIGFRIRVWHEFPLGFWIGNTFSSIKKIIKFNKSDRFKLSEGHLIEMKCSRWTFNCFIELLAWSLVIMSLAILSLGLFPFFMGFIFIFRIPFIWGKGLLSDSKQSVNWLEKRWKYLSQIYFFSPFIQHFYNKAYYWNQF